MCAKARWPVRACFGQVRFDELSSKDGGGGNPFTGRGGNQQNVLFQKPREKCIQEGGREGGSVKYRKGL